MQSQELSIDGFASDIFRTRQSDERPGGVNAYTEAWRRIGEAQPRPKSILSISAHWSTPGTAVTALAAPRTIHDFGGFPRKLYQVQYTAPGD